MKSIVIFIILSMVFWVGCSFLKTDDVWQGISIADVIATCLTSDDSLRLRKLIEEGLPLENYYDVVGNSKSVRPMNESVYPARTLLLEALHSGAVKCAQLLLEKEVDVCKVDGDGNNALILSACMPEECVVEIAERIVAGANVDLEATNKYNVTALGAAVKANNGQYVKWLLRRGANFNAFYGVDAKSRRARPIMFDAANARRDIFEMFMDLRGLNFPEIDLTKGGVLLWLNVGLSDYEDRIRRLVHSGASVKKVGEVLILNMKKLGDCKERISAICSYATNKYDLEKALRYAKDNKFCGSEEVIKTTMDGMEAK